MRNLLKRRAPRWLSITVSLFLIAFVLLLIVPVIIVHRDWAFVCEYTGSNMGYRKWCIGLKTHRWYRASPVETTIQKAFPDQLEHKWTSYAGTGYNIFGQRVLFGHGRPGPIFELRGGALEAYTARLGAQDIKTLYDLMRHGSREAKDAEVKRIQDLWLNEK